jgi:hypothetical protein
MAENLRGRRNQMEFPGMTRPAPSPGEAARKTGRIPHKAILASLQGPLDGPANLAGIYRMRVLPGKTRTIQLLGHKSPARIIQTLLGYEVQGSYKRIQCPDMVTARYLRLFLELGCRSIKLPYDPTVTAAVVPALEDALAAILAAILKMYPGPASLRLYVIRQVYRYLRLQLKSPLEPINLNPEEPKEL